MSVIKRRLHEVNTDTSKQGANQLDKKGQIKPCLVIWTNKPKLPSTRMKRMGREK